ncbi:hypothetical protein VTL71DRAFT_7727 [Oculimacula yallundae]|uniref:Lectin n=1 Tax=Oculimacula yallundae TaxID=86028 RepID=A0ABR4BUZ0_9HELO
MSPWVGSVFPSYGDHLSDKPDNTISVIDNANGDINHGMGGKFVWLVAQYHGNWSTAISDIRVVISDTLGNGASDLAKGAGGKFRYLEFQKGGSTRAAQLTLLRSSKKVTSDRVHELGYSGWTSDINTGRGGDFLHLIWKNEGQ